MKAEYNSLIYTYESNSIDIMNIIAGEFDAALEAEAPPDEINASKAVSDTVKSDENKAINKTNLINKVIEKVKALIKKIGEMFDHLKRKITNRLRLLNETDKGFFTMYRKRKSMVKPYSNVTVVSYKYNDQILDRTIEKMLAEITMSLEKLRAVEGTTNSSSRISDIINAPQGKTIEVLIEPYIKGSDQTTFTIDALIKYLVSQYRGEKTKLVFRDTDLANIEARAMSTKDIANKSNEYLQKAADAYNKIKTLEFQIKRNTSDEKVIKLVTANASKAAVLYNAYSALLSAYYELKLEESLNYRIVLKKFYQF